MGANRSKLIESFKSNTTHKLQELSINDLLDNKSTSTYFNNSNFNEFIREDLHEDDEDDSTSLVKYLELFKHDMLLSFTNTSIGKEIPNLATNYGKLSF